LHSHVAGASAVLTFRNNNAQFNFISATSKVIYYSLCNSLYNRLRSACVNTLLALHLVSSLAVESLRLIIVAQNTTQKSISIVFSVSSIRHDSSLSKYRKQKQSPLEILKMAHVQGGDCFCLRYLLSDESWRITLTQKTMEMDFCVVFCGCGITRSMIYQTC
jgi:hypothetical protein